MLCNHRPPLGGLSPALLNRRVGRFFYILATNSTDPPIPGSALCRPFIALGINRGRFSHFQGNYSQPVIASSEESLPYKHVFWCAFCPSNPTTIPRHAKHF
nr:MAG TPA: hypothetical protein [Caudoviricetes sp.]